MPRRSPAHTTTSTTTSPTERFIARQKIEEHRRKPTHQHRIIPPLNPNAPQTPPRREPAITLVPLDATHTGGVVTLDDCEQLRALGTPAGEAAAIFAERRARACE